MRHSLYLLLIGAVIPAAASLGFAEAAKTDAQADAPNPAQLRIEMHRAMADLIEARAAEKPDEAKIEKLLDRVQSLRVALRSQGAVPDWRAYPRGAWDGRQCPWGAPGMGRGMGPGKGLGYGYVQGMGRGGPGKGYGGGCGYGMCRAAACADCPLNCPACCKDCTCKFCPADCANCKCCRQCPLMPPAKPAQAGK